MVPRGKRPFDADGHADDKNKDVADDTEAAPAETPTEPRKMLKPRKSIPCATDQNALARRLEPLGPCAATGRKWIRGLPFECPWCQGNFCSATCRDIPDRRGHTEKCRLHPAVVLATAQQMGSDDIIAARRNDMEMDPAPVDKGKRKGN